MATDYDDLMEEARMKPPSRLPWMLLVLTLAAGAAASLVFLRRIEALRADSTSAGAKVLEADGKLAEARATIEAQQAKLQLLEKDKWRLLATQDELSSSVQAKEEELAKLKGTAQELEEKMKAEIGRGEIRLSQANGRLQVDLVDKILFDSGDAQISKRGEEVLARVGAVLSNVTDRQIQVAGHTDGAPISPRLVGRYPSNWELSTSRATNVVRFLEEKAHVSPRRLLATGYGSFHPLASNATPAGRARNRRIEILLTPVLDPASLKFAVAKAEPATRDEATRGEATRGEASLGKARPAAAKKAKKR